jgi:hypothetical protein
MVNPDRNLYEPPYDDALLYESDLEPERPRSRPLVVLLGIVVLAAFAGVVWVAYNQGVKHGQVGTPPILSAETGPTRIPAEAATAEPKDVAADKSYDRLFGDASDQPETVLPPAEQPRTVASAEVPIAEQDGTTAQGGPDTDIPPSVDPRMDSTTGISAPTSLTAGSPQPISSAPPTPLPSGSEDITGDLPPAAAAPKPVTAVKPNAPKIVSAPAKPVTTAAAPTVTMPIAPPPAAAVDTPAPEIAAVETPASTLATPSETTAPASGGGVAIQLGSFPNDKLAASAWAKIKSSNQELLGAYSPTIKSAQIDGKGTWYRLRVGGFADKSAAAGVCEQLKATGQACIIASK